MFLGALQSYWDWVISQKQTMVEKPNHYRAQIVGALFQSVFKAYRIENTALKKDWFQPFFTAREIQSKRQKANAVNPETVKQDEDGRQNSYAHEGANTYASNFLISINASNRC